VEGRICVRDLGSKHGVFVNGLRVAHASLAPGDQLTLGTTSLRISRADSLGLSKIKSKLRDVVRAVRPGR
jgi:pSer/pThr/pTyr-binding forkhead associated (FHA) protein